MRRRFGIGAASALVVAAACSTFSSSGDTDAGADAAAGDATPPPPAPADAAPPDAVRIGADDAGVPVFSCAVRSDAVFLGYQTAAAGIRRVDRVTGAVTLVDAQSAVGDVTTDDQAVYWLTGGSVCPAYVLKSSGAPDAAVSKMGLPSCAPARVVVAGQHVYVTAADAGVFYFAKEPLPAKPTLVASPAALTGAVTSDDVHVYAGARDAILEMQAAADASAASFVDAGETVDLLYDANSNVLHWASAGTVGTASALTGARTVFIGATHAARIAVDAKGLYWIDRVANLVWRYPREGGPPSSMGAHGEPVGLGVDAKGVVWCNTDGTVWTLPAP